MPSQKEVLNNLVADVETLKLKVTSLEGKFEVPLENPLEVPKEPVIELAVESKTEKTETSFEFPKYPIPPDFIATVHEVLNKNFRIELEPLPDSAGFMFSIIVPDKYSNVSPAQKPDGKDRRVKVITYSDGVNGVRLWAEKVLNNLDKDTQFRVVEDRPFANATI